MAVTKISARNATIKFSTSAVVFDTSTALNAETYANTVASAKNITVTFPKSDLELVPLLGESTNAIGSNVPVANTSQNAILDEKNWTLGMVSGTLVLRGDEDLEPLLFGSGQAITGGYTRYSIGDSASGKTRVTVGVLLIDLYNGSERATVVMAKALLNFGELKPTGTDGHFEIDFEGACLPENMALEYLD